MKLPSLIAILFIGYILNAQQTAFNPENTTTQLYQFAEFADLGKSELTIEQVLNDKALHYQPLLTENHSIGFTSNHYWLRFSIINNDEKAHTYYLETGRPVTDVAELYNVSKQEIIGHKSGDQIPFWERQVNHRATVFKVELPSNKTSTFYLHLKSDGETLNLPLNLYTESQFLAANYKQQLFFGIFYGILLLAGLIYLFFYSSLREKTFLYYGLYVLSIALMQAALDGFIFQYVFLASGYFNSHMVMIAALLTNFFLLKYCEYFLKIEQHLPKMHKLYKGIYVVLAVLFVFIFISPKTLELSYPISNVNGLLSLILILACVFSMYYKKMKVDPYFSLGIFFLVIGLLGFVMNNLSLLPNNFYTLNSAKFGTGMEVVFLSLSMTNLLRKLRQEKEESQVLALMKSEEISQLKTYFMSNMSHELRTPINAIMGIAQEQLELNKDTEDRRNFEIIKNASLSLLSNVNDILDFEKIEKNELKLKSEAFNPSILINQISHNWKTEAQKKGLNYVLDLDYNIPVSVKGDPERFTQILNNTLSNAVKFTEEGSVILKLDCSLLPGGKTKFNIVVSDTGVGMSQEAKASIFESFSQMRLNNKRRFGGIGLGLTIVKHLVTLFKGKIEIETEEGIGTKVFIELPIETLTQKNQAVNETELNPLKILVVEDNAVNQMIMKKLLTASGSVNFAIVGNGKEAIEALKKDVYDVVLMDLQMPIMDGYEATKIIRSGTLGDAIGGIPIIAVTADAVQETRQRVLDLGMNDYMTKPINKDLLLEKIKMCCVSYS